MHAIPAARTLARAWLAKGVPEVRPQNGEGPDRSALRYAGGRARRADLRDGDAAGGPSVASARLQFKSQRPTLRSAEAKARYVMAPYLPFIRRHRRKASARSPCRDASAHSPCRNAFARSRDPHHVWARCRFVQKPRGMVRSVAEYFAASKPRSCPHRGLARHTAARRRACRPFVVPTFPDTLAKTQYFEG
jgi:hypothetical protein